MCTMMRPSSEDPNLVVMGYPAMDRYRLQQEPCLGFPVSPASASNRIPSEQHDDSSRFHYPGTFRGSPSSSSSGRQQSTYNYYYCHHQTTSYRPLVPPDEPNHDPSFGRMLLALMIVLISGMCLMSVGVWLIFDAYIPDFAVTSLKVSNFKATDANLTGMWRIDMSIRNWNKDLSVDFDNVASSISYMDALLATSSVRPFQVIQMEKHILSFNISADDDANYAGKFHGGGEVAKELQHGTVAFGLRVETRAVFKKQNGEVHSWDNVEIFCGNMEVVFSSPGEGQLVPSGLGNTCLISVHKD